MLEQLVSVEDGWAQLNLRPVSLDEMEKVLARIVLNVGDVVRVLLELFNVNSLGSDPVCEDVLLLFIEVVNDVIISFLQRGTDW